jgi:hypothetical protein
MTLKANRKEKKLNTSGRISSLTITNGVPATQRKESRLAAGEALLCDLVPEQRRICNSDRSEPFEVKMAFKNYFFVLIQETVVKRSLCSCAERQDYAP